MRGASVLTAAAAMLAVLLTASAPASAMRVGMNDAAAGPKRSGGGGAVSSPASASLSRDAGGETGPKGTFPRRWSEQHVEAADRMLGFWQDSNSNRRKFAFINDTFVFFDFPRDRWAKLEPSNVLFFEGKVKGKLVRFSMSKKKRPASKSMQIQTFESNKQGKAWLRVPPFTRSVKRKLGPQQAFSDSLPTFEKSLATFLLGTWESQGGNSVGRGKKGFPAKKLDFTIRDGELAVIPDDDKSAAATLHPIGTFFEGKYHGPSVNGSNTNRFRVDAVGEAIVGEWKTPSNDWLVNFELERFPDDGEAADDKATSSPEKVKKTKAAEGADSGEKGGKTAPAPAAAAPAKGDKKGAAAGPRPASSAMAVAISATAGAVATLCGAF